jgi:hypothetical protein
MAATGKMSAVELSARYESGGTRAIKDYYRNNPVLVIFPDGKENCVTWTPHTARYKAVCAEEIANPATPSSGEIDLELIQKYKQLPEDSIICPIIATPEGDYSVSIGRDEKAGIQLRSADVSRFHAKFIREGGWYIQDFNSLNGTYIDGIQLFPQQSYGLVPYREIRFGSVRTMFLDTKSLLEVCRLT